MYAIFIFDENMINSYYAVPADKAPSKLECTKAVSFYFELNQEREEADGALLRASRLISIEYRRTLPDSAIHCLSVTTYV
jgi:hypothetical protein